MTRSTFIFLAILSQVAGFGMLKLSSQPVGKTSSTKLFAENKIGNGENHLDRRDAIMKGCLSALGGVAACASMVVEPAEASYSAFTRREEDWQDRVKNKEITVTSARSLREQLKEIAPANTEKSKIFCPNGPSSAVSPLMENKCGDRMAIPSVYGRYEDSVGNSIPGFATAKADSQMAFPKYK